MIRKTEIPKRTEFEFKKVLRGILANAEKKIYFERGGSYGCGTPDILIPDSCKIRVVCFVEVKTSITNCSLQRALGQCLWYNLHYKTATPLLCFPLKMQGSQSTGWLQWLSVFEKYGIKLINETNILEVINAIKCI
jgi:hypothetical protein